MENNKTAQIMSRAQELAMIINTRRELDELMQNIVPYLMSSPADTGSTVQSPAAETVSTVLYVPPPQSPIGQSRSRNDASTPNLETSPVRAKKGTKSPRAEYMKQLAGSKRKGRSKSASPLGELSQHKNAKNAFVISRLSSLIAGSASSSKSARKSLLL
jgi:hypothetical protein